MHNYANLSYAPGTLLIAHTGTKTEVEFPPESTTVTKYFEIFKSRQVRFGPGRCHGPVGVGGDFSAAA